MISEKLRHSYICTPIHTYTHTVGAEKEFKPYKVAILEKRSGITWCSVWIINCEQTNYLVNPGGT